MGEQEDINEGVSQADMEKIEPNEEQPPPPVGSGEAPADTDPDEDDDGGAADDLGQDGDDGTNPDGGPVENE
jgi:hypothetical protein